MANLTALESIWQRVGTTISPIVDGDDLDMGTGNIDTTGEISDGVLTISDGSITDAIAGTFSGTVQAEQLTSTDDITMQGHLFTLGNNSATDIVLSFDGSANDATITFDESADEFEFGDAAITTTGDITCDELTLTTASQDWKFTHRQSYAALVLQGQSNTNANFEFFSGDIDGSTDRTVFFRNYGMNYGGPAALIAYEYLQIGWKAAQDYYVIETQHAGDGAVDRPIKINNDTSSIYLDTSGHVGIDTVPSGNYNLEVYGTFGVTGSVWVNGAIVPMHDGILYLGEVDVGYTAWAGLVIKDQTDGKHYKCTLDNGAWTIAALD